MSTCLEDIQTSQVNQFEALRIHSERAENEALNDPLYAAVKFADLGQLCLAMEMKDVSEYKDTLVQMLVSEYKEEQSDDYLYCIQYAVANGCVIQENIFDCFHEYGCTDLNILSYLISEFGPETLFNNSGSCSIFKKYFFNNLLKYNKIGSTNQEWNQILTTILNKTDCLRPRQLELVKSALNN